MAAFAISASAVCCREVMGIIDQSPCLTRASRPTRRSPDGLPWNRRLALRTIPRRTPRACAAALLLAPPLPGGNANGCKPSTPGVGAPAGALEPEQSPTLRIWALPMHVVALH